MLYKFFFRAVQKERFVIELSYSVCVEGVADTSGRLVTLNCLSSAGTRHINTEFFVTVIVNEHLDL